MAIASYFIFEWRIWQCKMRITLIVIYKVPVNKKKLKLKKNIMVSY